MKTLAVTRPVGEGADTVSQIRQRGWRPLIVHTVELKPRPAEAIGQELTQIFSFGVPDWIVFMSAKGARLFFDAAMEKDELTTSIFERSRVVAVGPKTASSLRDNGAVKVDVPTNYSSEGIAEFFSKAQVQRKRIILARSSEASDVLEKRLKALGAFVTTLRLYDSCLPLDDSSVLEYLSDLSAGDIDATLFTSSLSASNLFRISREKSDGINLKGLLGKCLVGAIGPATSEKLLTLGVGPVIVPNRFVIEEAVTAVIEAVETKYHLVS